MRKSELEKLVKEQGEKIEKLEIIPKAREIAEKLGECKYRSKEWASKDYVFDDKPIRIHYEVYAMGDQEIDISYNRENVFHAKEGVEPKIRNHLFVHDDRSSYEILHYKPGEWTSKLDSLYNGIGKVLEARKLEKARKEALTEDPEVPENEMKDLQDRLGIKKRE